MTKKRDGGRVHKREYTEIGFKHLCEPKTFRPFGVKCCKRNWRYVTCNNCLRRKK